MKKSIIIGVLVLPLVACTTPQSNIYNVRTADFSKSTDEQLCNVYGYRLNRSAEAKSELIKRKVFTNSELNNITLHQVSVGMSECAVKAAFSINYIRQIDTNLINGGKGKSFIYSCGKSNVPYCPFTKVDMINGKVTAVSMLQKI